MLDVQDGWLHVRTMDDVTGFVPEESVSNVWLRISKKRQMLFVYRGTELALRVPVDLALNAIMDKERARRSAGARSLAYARRTLSYRGEKPGQQIL